MPDEFMDFNMASLPDVEDGKVDFYCKYQITKEIMVRAVAIKCHRHNQENCGTWPATDKKECYLMAGAFLVQKGARQDHSEYSPWAYDRALKIVDALWPELK